MARASPAPEEEGSVDFNTDDENLNGDFLMDDSPPYPEDPAADILPPAPNQRAQPAPEPEPTVSRPAPSVAAAKMHPGFEPISMDEPSQKSTTSGRLLMRRTLNKAADTGVSATPKSEAVDEVRAPQQSEMTSQLLPPPPIPPIPKKQHAPVVSEQKSDPSSSMTPTSFEMFAKLPPVPKPDERKDTALPFPVAHPEVHSSAAPAPFVPEPTPFVPEPKPFVPEPKPFVPAQPFMPPNPMEQEPFIPSEPSDPLPLVETLPKTVHPKPQPVAVRKSPSPRMAQAAAVQPDPVLPTRSAQPETLANLAPSPQPMPSAPSAPIQQQTQPVAVQQAPVQQQIQPAPLQQQIQPMPEANVPQVQQIIPQQPVQQTQPIVQQVVQQPQVMQSPVQQVIQPAPVLVAAPTMRMQVPQSPTQMMERGFTSSLDRTFTSFRRTFAKELSSMMRNPSHVQTNQVDLDEFTESLTSAIGQLIEAPIPPPDFNTQQLSRRIAAAIQEQTTQMTSVLADVDAQNTTAVESHIAELRQLQDEVENLRVVFKTSTEGVIRELERERQNKISIATAERARIRELDTRMRSIKLKQVELETRASHQNSERENLDRLSKQLIQKRREWEDDYFIQDEDEGESLRQRLLQEISALRQEADQDSAADIGRLVEEGLRAVKEESDNMRNELIGLEMANRWAMAKLQQLQATRTQSPSPRRERQRSSVISEAKFKVHELRRQRESNIRGITESIR